MLALLKTYLTRGNPGYRARLSLGEEEINMS